MKENIRPCIMKEQLEKADCIYGILADSDGDDLCGAYVLYKKEEKCYRLLLPHGTVEKACFEEYDIERFYDTYYESECMMSTLRGAGADEIYELMKKYFLTVDEVPKSSPSVCCHIRADGGDRPTKEESRTTKGDTKMNENVIERAVRFAEKAHEGQLRKGTELPYIVHPMEAMEIVKTLTDDEEVIAAAVLHDVIEDTAFGEEDIRREFGDRVTELVKAESENKRKELPEDATWKIRKTETIKELDTASVEAKMICLGDKLANARAIVRDYGEIGEKLWERFNASPEEIEWYYTSIVECLKELADTDAWKELSGLMQNKAFNQNPEEFGSCFEVDRLRDAIEGKCVDPNYYDYEPQYRDVRAYFWDVLINRCQVYVPCVNKEGTPDALFRVENAETGLEYAVMLTHPDGVLNRVRKVDVLDFLNTVVNSDRVNGLVIDPNDESYRFRKVDLRTALEIVREERKWTEDRYVYELDRLTEVIPTEWVESEGGHKKGLLNMFCVGEEEFSINADVYDTEIFSDVRLGQRARMCILMLGNNTVVYDSCDEYERMTGRSFPESCISSGTFPIPANEDVWKPSSEVIMSATVLNVNEYVRTLGNDEKYLSGVCECLGNRFFYMIPKTNKHLHKGCIISGMFWAMADELENYNDDDASPFVPEAEEKLTETQYIETVNALRGLRNKANEHVLVSFDGREENEAAFIQAVKTDEILGRYRVEIGFGNDTGTDIYALDGADFESAAKAFRAVCVDGETELCDAKKMGFVYYDTFGGD